ncbi:MAG: hypothetical protein KAH17_04635 [Bacteroidales bacterium]|nr:hypothetical protein [Bacteroidales bacterium]
MNITILCLLLIIIKGSIIFAQEPVTIKFPDPKKFSADIEEFIVDKSYLPLETRSDCLLPGHSPRIYIYKDLIYVLYAPLEGYNYTEWSSMGSECRRYNFFNP